MINTVAIAGATGFVGRALLQKSGAGYRFVGLSRQKVDSQNNGTQHNVSQHEWREADFFSVQSLACALQGCDSAVYLIHSMMPTARLDQSRFEDTDLWLADTFARAAAIAGVKRMIYLGGLIPQVSDLSLHLKSRQEVEAVLSSTGVPVVTLRAGLILGADGSSFQILYLLVKRLPWMLCPRWAWTKMQPIALTDVVSLIDFCLKDQKILEVSPQVSYDIGGPDVLTYRELMLLCAKKIGVERKFFPAPFFNPSLSTLWVCLVTGASQRLVAPLVKSMTHPMVVKQDWLITYYGKPLMAIDQALSQCLKSVSTKLGAETKMRKQARSLEKDVRSIQRLPLPSGWSAQDLVRAYFHWTAKKFYPFIIVESSDVNKFCFVIKIYKFRIELLSLEKRFSSDDSMLISYAIVGGCLLAKNLAAARTGFFEFRASQKCGYGLVGLHGYYPRLPWVIYKSTQAIVHQWIMNAFARWLLKKL